ncbi:hypothetical protein L6773_21195 [Rhodohalobacter sp. WB101]|uniref:Uncharacterized protein n=1 Tax=Rhodohalobacter sulfatireducens TaxID=2911366 RepID=A0ABS9KJS4_9BACT|nr:hypothetical protein [Rhodohalobacter sulfatireducens]
MAQTSQKTQSSDERTIYARKICREQSSDDYHTDTPTVIPHHLAPSRL